MQRHVLFCKGAPYYSLTLYCLFASNTDPPFLLCSVDRAKERLITLASIDLDRPTQDAVIRQALPQDGPKSSLPAPVVPRVPAVRLM